MKRPRGAARSAVGLFRGVASVLAGARDAMAVAVGSGAGEGLPVGAPVRVVSWNLQFCAGRGRRFFFDGGDQVHVGADEVEDVLGGVIGLLRGLAPDVVLLQEVDRGSDRTAGIDQHRRIADALGLGHEVSAPYHRSGYVPHPPHRHLGRVDMHLSVLSRWPIASAVRHPLPLLREPWLRQQFNLRRAVLEVRVLLAGGGHLTLLDTHLSAFSYGDGTLARQVGVVGDLADRLEGQGGSWLLAGDFNALPPGDDPARLGEDGALYPEVETPLRPLFERHRTPLAPAAYLDPAQRTWVPWGANRPDRTIDYVFHGSAVDVAGFRVVPAGARWSDHLPLAMEARVRPRGS